METLAGTRLGRFHMRRLIGKGGMGEVYAAKDENLDREVAVKVLGEEFNAEPHRRRFMREAKLAARLNHPNIASIHEVGESDGRLYIVMELLEGEPLRNLITVRKLSIEEILIISRDVARALARAHASEVIHRDIKPENIFITHPAPDVLAAKVLDFGLARDELARRKTDEESTATDLTGPGEACGTAGYLAPEQARGLAVDVRADVFSFGAVMYEMMTGKRAFDGKNQLTRMLAVVKTEPSPIELNAPEVPADIVAIVKRCLAKSPDERYANGAEVLAALEERVRSSQRMPVATPSQQSMLVVSSDLERATPPDPNASFGASRPVTDPTPLPVPSPADWRRRAMPYALIGGAVGLMIVGAILIVITLTTTGPRPAKLVASADPTPPAPTQSAVALVTAAPSEEPTPAALPPPPTPDEPAPAATTPTVVKAKHVAAGGQAAKAPTPTSAPAPSAAAPAAPVQASTGTVKVGQEGVLTIVVDGEHRRIKDGQVVLPCGRHKIRAGFGSERVVDVPCGGTVSL